MNVCPTDLNPITGSDPNGRRCTRAGRLTRVPGRDNAGMNRIPGQGWRGVWRRVKKV